MKNQQELSQGQIYSVMPNLFSSLHQPDGNEHTKNTIEKEEVRLRIDSFYFFLLKNAINEQIEKAGCWVVMAGSSMGKFDDAIANKYSIQFKSCATKGLHGDFQLEVELIGVVGAILEKFSMYTVFEASLPNNNGADKYKFLKEGDIENLRMVHSDIWNSEDIYTIKEFEDIYTQITDPYKLMLSGLASFQH